MDVFVLDTSAIIDGRIIDMIQREELKGRIVIPIQAIAELEHQANLRKESGFAGLSVIKKLRELEKEKDIEILTLGERPKYVDIKLAKITGEIDAGIRKLAKELGATLITGDYVMYDVALAEGVNAILLHPKEEKDKVLEFEKFFDEITTSIHLKEGVPVKRKRGTPGEWKLENLKVILDRDDLKRISNEIVEQAKARRDAYIEIDRLGATVVQLGKYRIVIAKPPFADGFEITAVKPIKKLTIWDYKLPQKLMERLDKQAEGILICGPPGSGKSTFATALAEYYSSKGKIVKTLEEPRDMQVSEEITQYTKLEGSFEYTKDVLLLVRPDYTFYDEVRKTEDFLTYADLRLAGIGLVGVVHATKTIDAIQRFIDKVELGMIPHIVDTIIFIKGGKVEQVYVLNSVVKVPTGMTEKDLARPVIEIRDFFSGSLEYEIYKFGEETVVVPIKEIREDKSLKAVEKVLKRLLSYPFYLEKNDDVIILYADSRDIPKLFKKYKKRFERLQKKFGPIEIREK